MAQRKPQDSADGCRALEQADRLRAAATPNSPMRQSLERSADAWSARASMLDGLAAGFTERAAENVENHPKRGRQRKHNG